MSTQPRPLERQLEAFFRQRVRLAGGYTVKLAPMEAGVPDRMVIFPGNRIYLVELKTETGTVSPIQHHWHEVMKERWDVHVHVVVGHEGIIRWIRTVVNAMAAGRRNP